MRGLLLGKPKPDIPQDAAERKLNAILAQLDADQRHAAQIAVQQYKRKARERARNKARRASRKANRAEA